MWYNITMEFLNWTSEKGLVIDNIEVVEHAVSTYQSEIL
jgi:hypothetical protein